MQTRIQTPLSTPSAVALALTLAGCAADVTETPTDGATSGAESAASAPGRTMAGTSSETAAFERLTGVPTHVHHMFSAKATWDNLNGTASYLAAVRNYLDDHPADTVVLSYSLYPRDVTNGVARCASGEFQSHYRGYGRALRAAHLGGIILRIGWEWNQWFDWGRWISQDYDTRAPRYAQCFRNIVSAIRGEFPENHLRFDWNSTDAATTAILQKGYPGNDYVDIVSVEGYDNKGSRTSMSARWAALEQSLNVVATFARDHGKPTAIPEWGVTGDSRWFVGDNAYYVEHLCGWLRDPANNVLYYTYFDQLMKDGTDFRLRSYPRSLAAYRAHCAGSTSAR